MPSISAKHALTPEEINFCKIYVAFGHTNYTDAYRRAFYASDEWTDDDEAVIESRKTKGARKLKLIPEPKEINRKASLLLDKDYIQAYVAEIGRPVTEHAEIAMHDQVLFGDDAASRRAAEMTLAREDQLGRRDAALFHAEVLSAIGTEVVIPIPGGGEQAFCLREMFPRYADAMPPDWVIEKTIRSLEMYRKAQKEAEGADV